MKALSKKSLILVLSFIFALSALMFAFSFKPVKAETGTTISSWQVMEGAQIRLGGAGTFSSGLRFRVKMDYQTASYVKANDNVTMGFIITPKYYFDNRAASADGAEVAYGTDDYFYSIERYVEKDNGGIKVNEDKIYISDDAGLEIIAWDSIDDAATPLGKSYYVNGAIKGIIEENLDREYCVVAYIYDGTKYTYAVTEHDFARTYMTAKLSSRRLAKTKQLEKLI